MAGRTLGRSDGRVVGRMAGQSVGCAVGRSGGRQGIRSVGRSVGPSLGPMDGRSVQRRDSVARNLTTKVDEVGWLRPISERNVWERFRGQMYWVPNGRSIKGIDRERREVRSGGRPEFVPEMGAQRSDLDDVWHCTITALE